MSRVSGYNHINTIADAKGFSDEERKIAVDEAAKVAEDSFVPAVFKEDKSDTLDISENYKAQKQERTLDELMDFVKSSDVQQKYDKHAAVSNFINSKTTLNTKPDDHLSDADKAKKSLVEKMKDALDENEEKQMDVNSIAKKIARGRKCSKKELEYLKKTDEVKYRKAIAANEARKLTETRLKGIKDKEQLRNAINSAKAAALGTSDTDFAILIS